MSATSKILAGSVSVSKRMSYSSPRHGGPFRARFDGVIRGYASLSTMPLGQETPVPPSPQ